MISKSPESSENRVEYLDALRGIAILGVLLVHSGSAASPTNSVFVWLVSNGARGVQLFYVVSAITLCMSWSKRSQSDEWPVRSFYLRRFFRVAPLFYIAICLYLVLDGFASRFWAPDGITWKSVVLTVLFIHGFDPESINAIVPGGWSIAVEATFYAVFPLLVSRIRPSNVVVVFGASVIIASNSLVVMNVFDYPEPKQYLLSNFIYLNFFGQLPVFVTGVAAYFVISGKYSRQAFQLWGAMVLVASSLEFVSPTITRNFLPNHVLASIIFSVTAIYLAEVPLKVFVNLVTVYFGRVSYSMYLIHFAVLDLFSKVKFSAALTGSNFGSVAHFVCLVFATAAIANITYRLVEQPGVNLGARCLRKLLK